LDSLVDAHSHSTLSFHAFASEMQITETKLKGLLPTICLSFVTAFKRPLEDVLAAEKRDEEVLRRVASLSAEAASEVSRLQSDSHAFAEQLKDALPGFWAHIADPVACETATSTQGYLWKKAGRHWKRRLCMISNGVLCYGKTPQSAMRTAKKNIPLLYCSVKQEPMSSRPNCFSIRGSAKSKFWVFQALTPRAVNTWLAVIQNNIMQRLLDPDDSGPRAEDDTHMCGLPREGRHLGITELVRSSVSQLRECPLRPARECVEGEVARARRDPRMHCAALGRLGHRQSRGRNP
jgi:hypothetical protein